MTGSPQLKIVADNGAGNRDDPDRAESHETIDCSDALLLDAWLTRHDADAFAALVNRYARLVMGVCRRQCRTSEDAEDAFQATFLVMARDVKRLRRAERLPGWLHKTAYRTARRAAGRNRTMTEALLEEPVARSESLEKIAQRHRLRTLDEELDRLPEQYRTAIVLHYYEGYTYQQTAELLGCSGPAIRGRLQRGRELLQRRLVQRGISLSVAFAAIGAAAGREAVAEELIHTAATSAVTYPSGGPVAPHLEPLLATEPAIMMSPTILGTLGASLLTVTGLIVAQVATAGSGRTSGLTVSGSSTESGGPVYRVAGGQDDNPFADTDDSSDPFGGGGDAVAQPARTNPFGSDFDAGGIGDPFDDSTDPRVNPFGGGTPNGRKPRSSSRPNPVVSNPASPSNFGNMMGSNRMDSGSAAPQRAVLDTTGMTPKAMFHSPWTATDAETAERIENELAIKTQFEFTDDSLEMVVETWNQEYEIPIVIDERALDDLGLNASDVLIDAKMAGVSLEAAMELVLGPHDLVYTINDEVLKITSVDADESENQLIRVYWSGANGLQATEATARMLQTLINPETWEQTGGQGSIGVLESGQAGASGFAVRNTYRTHKKLERFLASVRDGASGPVTGAASQSGTSGNLGAGEMGDLGGGGSF